MTRKTGGEVWLMRESLSSSSFQVRGGACVCQDLAQLCPHQEQVPSSGLCWVLSAGYKVETVETGEGGRNISLGIASVKLTCAHVCGTFSGLLIDGGEHSPVYTMLPGQEGLSCTRKMAEQTRGPS